MATAIAATANAPAATLRQSASEFQKPGFACSVNRRCSIRGHTPAGAVVSANSTSRLASRLRQKLRSERSAGSALQTRAQRGALRLGQEAEHILGDEDAVLVRPEMLLSSLMPSGTLSVSSGCGAARFASC